MKNKENQLLEENLLNCYHTTQLFLKSVWLLQRNQHNWCHEPKQSIKALIQSCFAAMKQLLQATYPLVTAHKIGAQEHQQPWIFHQRSCRFHKTVHHCLVSSHLEVCSRFLNFVFSTEKNLCMLFLLPERYTKQNQKKTIASVNLLAHYLNST